MTTGNSVAEKIMQLEGILVPWTSCSPVSSAVGTTPLSRSEIVNRLMVLVLPIGLIFFWMRGHFRKN